MPNASRASYLTFVDEHTGSWLCAKAFPYAHVSQIPQKEFQQALIEVFLIWGKPGACRVDNGAPLGNPKMSSTSAIALWLICLEIDMIWNKPRSPQMNPKVERMQATSANWVTVRDCADMEELQRRLDDEAEVQRMRYPVKRLDGKTRMEAYPELLTAKRPYHAQDFSVERAHQFLSKKTYIRKADKGGCIVLYNQLYNLSVKYKGCSIQAKFDAQKAEWHFYSDRELIKVFAAQNLTKERILDLTVYQRTNTK